jgi:hypothetical protein
MVTMAEKGGTKIIWYTNNWNRITLLISSISIIFFPFFLFLLWKINQDIGLLFGGFIIYMILPYPFLYSFIHSPKAIGFSNNGIHGKFLYCNNYYRNLNKKYPVDIAIFIFTKFKVYVINNTSIKLLLKIVNQHKSYMKYKSNYEPRKIYLWYKNIFQVPIEDIGY